MTARQTLSELYDIDTGPHGDAWGFAMGALFDVAHALEHYGREYPPAEWQYRDSVICSGLVRHESGENDTARLIAARILRGREQDWRHAGDVLLRYCRILERAGRSY